MPLQTKAICNLQGEMFNLNVAKMDQLQAHLEIQEWSVSGGMNQHMSFWSLAHFNELKVDTYYTWGDRELLL